MPISLKTMLPVLHCEAL